jgi:hypothetical protein
LQLECAFAKALRLCAYFGLALRASSFFSL